MPTPSSTRALSVPTSPFRDCANMATSSRIPTWLSCWVKHSRYVPLSTTTSLRPGATCPLASSPTTLTTSICRAPTATSSTSSCSPTSRRPRTTATGLTRTRLPSLPSASTRTSSRVSVHVWLSMQAATAFVATAIACQRMPTWLRRRCSRLPARSARKSLPTAPASWVPSRTTS